MQGSGAAIAAKLYADKPSPVGRPAVNPAPGAGLTPTPTPSTADLAERLEVSTRTVEQAKRVQRSGLGDAVIKGETSLKQADASLRPGYVTVPSTATTFIPKAIKYVPMGGRHGDAYRIMDLESEIRYLRDQQSEDPSGRDAEFQRLRLEIKTLKTSVDVKQAKIAELQVELRALEAEIKRLRKP